LPQFFLQQYFLLQNIHRNIAIKLYKCMGVTKSNLFTEAQNDIALAAKAFAHPARVAIIQYLLKANACINGDLVQELGLAQATISQHLRELKDIGIIQGSIEGTRINYCINPGRWAEIKGQFNELFSQFEIPSAGDCC
jgi:predicted transcriptional regulator